MSCSVCCLDFTSVKRVKITCAYCQYEACQECYRTYISSTVQDAHCMSCRRVWDRAVLSSYFPVAWLNGAYKRHREVVLIEREKQLLPESQHLVTNYRYAKRLRAEMDAKTTELQAIKTRANALQRDIYTAKYRVENLERNGYRGNAADEERVVRQKLEFIAPCPIEDCRGFMNAKMVCGTCGVVACEHCGIVKEEDHVCDKDIAANFKVIKGQTKPCPKCAVPTMKSSGCSQMWCTQCHTTWAWNTGEIQQGVIHNPHYFQYMRERSENGEIPRQPGDQDAGPVNCDRQVFPRSWDVSDRIRNETRELFGLSRRNYVLSDKIKESEAYKERTRLSDELSKILRKLLHIQEVEVRTLRHREDHARDNADLRLKYLVNEISEEDFRVLLQRREKKRQKDTAVCDIYQMVCDTGRDVFWMYMDGTKNLKDTIDELNALRSYANTHLRSVCTQYKMNTALI